MSAEISAGSVGPVRVHTDKAWRGIRAATITGTPCSCGTIECSSRKQVWEAGRWAFLAAVSAITSRGLWGGWETGEWDWWAREGLSERGHTSGLGAPKEGLK